MIIWLQNRQFFHAQSLLIPSGLFWPQTRFYWILKLRSVRCAAFYLLYWLFLSVSGQEWQHHGSAFFCWKTGTGSRTSGCTDNTLANSQKDHYLQWQFLWPSFSQKTVRNKSYQATIFRYSVGGSVPGSLSSEEPDPITGLQTEIHWNLSPVVLYLFQFIIACLVFFSIQKKNCMDFNTFFWKCVIILFDIMQN